MKYFSINEFVVSSTAKSKRIDNTPSEEIKQHIIEAVDKLYDPLREAWGNYCNRFKLGKAGIKVNSGYRCPALNAAVGGAKTSGHLSGYAADLYPLNGKLDKFIPFVKDWLKVNNIQFDECLNEYDRWLHMSYKSINGLQRKKIGKIS